MSIIVISLFSFVILTILVLLLLLLIKPKIITKEENTKYPIISILIAARNEEVNLPLLFESLKKLDYPSSKLDILLGDDMSEDKTADLMLDFCSTESRASYTLIKPTNIQIAKANVLMQLADKAKGEFLYFLDADMIPNPSILKEYVNRTTSNVAGITGITLPIGKSLADNWQKIDWATGLGTLSMVERFGKDTTAMGNNMFLRKSAYEEIGGYASIPVSTVEDFALYKALRDKGYEFPLQFIPGLLSFTHPMKTFKSLLHQRKRWMQGGMQVSLFLQFVLVTQYLFYPIILLLCFFNPFLGGKIWLFKMVVQWIYHYIILGRMGQRPSFIAVISYDIYNSLFTCLLLLFYLMPIKMNWKGRVYGI